VEVGVAFLDDVMVDQIGADARAADPGRVLLTVIAVVFFTIGWVAAKVLGGLWLAVAWSGMAVRAGWREGRKTAGRVPTAAGMRT